MPKYLSLLFSFLLVLIPLQTNAASYSARFHKSALVPPAIGDPLFPHLGDPRYRAVHYRSTSPSTRPEIRSPEPRR